MGSLWPPSLATIAVAEHTTARDQTIAKVDLAAGATVLRTPAFASALLLSRKGTRCDYCLRIPQGDTPLKRCTGCMSYWYCDAQCQTAQWQQHHKRICKKYSPFIVSNAFQGLEHHEKMDALLLSHLCASLSMLPIPYGTGQSPELAVFLSLLPGLASEIASPPPICPIAPSPKADLISNLYERFGNNNFTVHSHLTSVAHAIFPLASRLFNHSCIPNAAPKYHFTHSKPPSVEVIALKEIKAGEEICIPYLDPALLQTKSQIFQFTYGFTCHCPSCEFLTSIGTIPSVPTDTSDKKKLSRSLRDFAQVDSYLVSDAYQTRLIQELPQHLYPVLNESFMSELSESFSKASHEGNHGVALDAGITLLSLYLVVYPNNYPQIGMHLLEMAKAHWNYSFVITEPSKGEKQKLKGEITRLLDLARRVLGVTGAEGDEDGPLQEIATLQSLVEEA